MCIRDSFTTLIDSSPLPGADVAQIITRAGSRRIGLVASGSAGSTIAVSPTATQSHLRLPEVLGGVDTFFLHFDSDTNAVSTSLDSISGLPQILVTNEGDVTSVRLAGRTIEHADLVASTDTVVETGEPEPESTNVCRWPLLLEPASGADLTNDQINNDDNEPVITNGVDTE